MKTKFFGEFVTRELATNSLAFSALSLRRIKFAPLIFHTPHSTVAGRHYNEIQRARGEANSCLLQLLKVHPVWPRASPCSAISFRHEEFGFPRGLWREMHQEAPEDFFACAFPSLLICLNRCLQ